MRKSAWAGLAVFALVTGLIFAAGSLGWGQLAAAEAPQMISDDDAVLLARICTAEAQGEPYEGQVAVVAVVLNRTQHPGFPNDIPGVIFEPGAFEPVDNGTIWGPIAPSCENAARDALNGWDPTNGAVFFFNPDKTNNAFMWSLPQTLWIGKHVFSLGMY